MDVGQNKDKSILEIYQLILECFEQDFFTLPNFWDADNFAIGLLRECKLIYISTWDFRDQNEGQMRYYSEFEIVDAVTFETVRTEHKFENIGADELIFAIKTFVYSDISCKPLTRTTIVI